MRSTAALALASLAIACSFNADGLGSSSANLGTTSGGASATSTGEQQPTQETTSLDTGGTVGNPPGTSDSGPGTGLDSSSGDAESSSTGEPPTPLIDDGLLGRWYIDDAAAGTPPDQMLADSAPSPFDLLMVYVEDAPDFAMVDGNLGLRWLAAEQYGRPMAPVFNTKIHQTLGVSTAATFEIVVVIQDVSDATSRLMHFGFDDDSGDFAIGTRDLGEAEVRWSDQFFQQYTLPMPWSGSRQVVHVVVDTALPTETQRLQLFVDGVPATEMGSITAPALDATIPIDSASMMVLGNRSDGERSFRGRLQYAAIYTAALTPAQLTSNVGVLLDSDDAP